MNTQIKHQFPKGTYYIGDLCYILNDEWDEVCEAQSPEEPTKLKDGRIFAMYGTAWGDGVYEDKEGREYWVDSGTIGCVKVKRGQKPIKGGQLIKFTEPFSVSSKNGAITIGPVQIDTDPDEEDDE